MQIKESKNKGGKKKRKENNNEGENVSNMQALHVPDTYLKPNEHNDGPFEGIGFPVLQSLQTEAQLLRARVYFFRHIG